MIYARNINRLARRVKIGRKYKLPRAWLKGCDLEFLDLSLGIRDMRCVEKYSNFAVFETAAGVRTAFRYTELMTLLSQQSESGEQKENETSLIF